MTSFCIRPATAADSVGLLNLLAATDQQGSIRLTFERAPDYFHAAAVSTEEPDIWLMEKAGHGVIATFSIGRRRVFMNGQPTVIRYGSDLRIHPNFQGGRTLFRLFTAYREQMQNDWMQTVILEENRASLNTVGSGRSILPQYIPVGTFTTRLISLRNPVRNRKSSNIRRAGHADIPAMQAFFNREAARKQFYPCCDFSAIGSTDPYYRHIALTDFFLQEEQGDITAMAGLWNQKAFKQTRVTGYSPLLNRLRPIYNGITRLSGHLPLPPPGALHHYQLLHSLCVKHNNPERFAPLLHHIIQVAGRSGSAAIACGFDSRDPLLNIACQYRGHTLKSRNFIATYQPEQVQQLDLNRLQYPEISRL